MFIIDDFFVWLWCKITNCSKHQDAPQAAPQKERVKTVEVEKNTTKNDSNKSNGSNSTNATKSDGGKTESKAGASNEPLGLDDDILKQVNEKKAAQSKERDAGAPGDSAKKAAEDAVANNKDMAAGEGNTFKDETPAQLAARQK
jgi:hypothetical protein